jgi:hypothetical protein
MVIFSLWKHLQDIKDKIPPRHIFFTKHNNEYSVQGRETMNFVNMLNNAVDFANNGLIKNPVTWLILVILSVLPLIPWIGFAIVVAVMIISNLGGLYGSSMMGSTGSMQGLEGLYGSIALLIVLFIAALIISILLGTFYQGFLVRILRGNRTLPEINDFANLFTDGIKFFIIQMVYLIPPLVALVATLAAAWFIGAGGNPNFYLNPAAWVTIAVILLLGLFITGILAIILALFWVIGIIQFARTGEMLQAFRFGQMLTTIKKIGWIPYFIALAIIVIFVICYSVVFSLASMVTSMVPFVGIIFYLGIHIVELILAPVIAVIIYRYFSLLYDSAGNT